MSKTDMNSDKYKGETLPPTMRLQKKTKQRNLTIVAIRLETNTKMVTQVVPKRLEEEDLPPLKTTKRNRDSPALSTEGTLFVNGTAAIGFMDDDFVCATIDWWPPQKCDYGTCSWGSASLLNLVSQQLRQHILDPSVLDGISQTFKSLQSLLEKSNTPAVAWVGESGGAYNSGHNLTVTLKFKSEVSTESPGRLSYLNFQGLRGSKGSQNVREEYHLTAKDGDLHSKVMLLNGKALSVDSSGNIPALEPITVGSSDPTTVAPFSIVFVHIPSIIVPACK
ncbi:hypothetical protein GBA52_001008 [Prunus armeniaca]|nr:hypothetical protein GBA52_001008 [Prunus armeniaca]